jgi:hypothetical protein
VRAIEIALSTRPEVKAVLKAGFPSYNKRKCYVSVWPGSQRIVMSMPLSNWLP